MKDNLKNLLGQGEGFNLEFKESFDSNLGKEICAFANANGGIILLGVSDLGVIKGVNITNKLKSQVTDIVRNFDPKFQIDFVEQENVLIIKVSEGINKPYSIGGKFYLRNGPNSQQLGRDEIRTFFQKEGLILWDEKENIKFDLDKDFNKVAFDDFVQKSNISKVLNKKQILQNLFLLENNHLKNAGVLLFAKDTQKIFHKAMITCVLYEGIDKVNIIDKKDFTGDLHSNYQDVLNYLKSKLNTRIIITGGPHKTKLELPEEALREALVNAIGHRDYHALGAKILVEISFDRVEITNPGGLVKSLKIKDFGKKSMSRNNLLFGLLQRMKLVENVGSGIKRMRQLMKKEGLEEPLFDINENWFVVSFKRLPLEKGTNGLVDGLVDGLVESQKKILKLMKKSPQISKEEMARKIGISTTALDKNINTLKKKGLLTRIGPAKGGHWKVNI